jgi:hydroxymethylglutaryl-CoA synthase
MAWEDYEVSSGSSGDDFAVLAYHCPLVSLVEQAHALHMEIAAPESTPDEVADSLDRRVLPGMRYNRRLGNIYSGSLYASLLGLLEGCEPPPGSRAGCFSYGSGACGEFFSARTTSASGAALREAEAGRCLDERTAVDFDAYLELLDASAAQLAASDLTLTPTAGPTPRLALTGIDNHHRRYEWA